MVRDRRTGQERTLTAPYFLDATELGDLLPMTGVEYVTGAEARDRTGEPHAPPSAQPGNQQGITCCFAVEYLDGQDHTIDRPAEYAFWRDSCPRTEAALAGAPDRPDLLQPDHAQAGQPRVRSARGRGGALALPADPRPP